MPSKFMPTHSGINGGDGDFTFCRDNNNDADNAILSQFNQEKVTIADVVDAIHGLR